MPASDRQRNINGHSADGWNLTSLPWVPRAQVSTDIHAQFVSCLAESVNSRPARLLRKDSSASGERRCRKSKWHLANREFCCVDTVRCEFVGRLPELFDTVEVGLDKHPAVWFVLLDDVILKVLKPAGVTKWWFSGVVQMTSVCWIEQQSLLPLH